MLNPSTIVLIVLVNLLKRIMKQSLFTVLQAYAVTVSILSIMLGSHPTITIS